MSARPRPRWYGRASPPLSTLITTTGPVGTGARPVSGLSAGGGLGDGDGLGDGEGALLGSTAAAPPSELLQPASRAPAAAAVARTSRRRRVTRSTVRADPAESPDSACERRVVDLEERRHRPVPGEAEQPGHAAPPDAAGVLDGSVVERPGQGDPGR